MVERVSAQSVGEAVALTRSRRGYRGLGRRGVRGLVVKGGLDGFVLFEIVVGTL